MTFRYGDRVSLDGEMGKVFGVVHGAEPALDSVTVRGDSWGATVPASRLFLVERPGLALVSAQGDLFSEVSA